MKSIKRLHLILFLIVLGAVGLFIEYSRQRQPQKPEKPRVEVKKPIPKLIPKPTPQPKKPEDTEKTARQAVAVAGEYWKIARKQGRDFSKGQATLRLAKVALNAKNHQEAIRLAKQSIKELKSAPRTGVNYKVISGDCLWNIAKMKKHYGKGSEWGRIWYANQEKIPNYRLIYPNQILFVPKTIKKGDGSYFK